MAHMMKRIAVFLLLAYGDTAYGESNLRHLFLDRAQKLPAFSLVFLQPTMTTILLVGSLVLLRPLLQRSSTEGGTKDHHVFGLTWGKHSVTRVGHRFYQWLNEVLMAHIIFVHASGTALSVLRGLGEERRK